jgi:hypothetical protein
MAMTAEQLEELRQRRGYEGPIAAPEPDKPTELPQYADLANQAAGLSGDTATADYIRELASGKYGEADTKNAFGRLIEEGRLRNVEASRVASDGSATDDKSTVASFTGEPGAEEILRAGLAQYGLESLYQTLWGKYTSKAIDIADPAGFIYALRDEPAYKARFAGNEKRKSMGFTELSPATYLALEKSYKDTLSINGLPQGFYDSPDDFQKLIGGDVSVSELNNRLKDAYSVVRDATPAVKAKLSEMYGITDGDILAYVIDADRARPLMSPDYKRQAQAALIAESAQRYAGINLGAPAAEQFVRQNITQAEAEKAFSGIGQLAEFRRANIGEEKITDQQLAEAALGTNTESTIAVERRRKGRVAGFAGGGSATMTQGESSSIKSGIGQANTI